MIRLSILSLVLVNLLPLAGVFLLDWKVSNILFLYWSENLVIGGFNLLKMKKARGTTIKARYSINNKSPSSMSRKSMMVFFVIHYGMFTLTHGFFVLALFGFFSGSLKWLLLSLLFLFFSHGVSYHYNFLDGGEYKRMSYQDLFIQPYSRVVVMHITIIFGGFLAKLYGSPQLALLVMVGLKIIIDIFLHLKERKKSL